ncbi:MAG: 50S ribosomal protein L10 [Candidatus Pacearchaeota archaeon]
MEEKIKEKTKERKKKKEERESEKEEKSKKKARERIALKEKEVEKLIKKCEAYSNLVMSNIERIPANQFKQLRKKLSREAEKVEIKVIKRSLAERLLEKLKISTEGLDKILSKPLCILLTNKDPFSLASLLEDSKEEAFLKPGQSPEKDLIIEPKSTDLPATAVVELSKAGLKVSVEKGKVVIKEKKVIKAGEKIDEDLALALQKLNIKPLRIGLNVDLAIDLKSKKIYKNIVINKAEELEKLKSAANNALNLALGIAYPCEQTISYLIRKAFLSAQSLKGLEKNKSEQVQEQVQSEANK